MHLDYLLKQAENLELSPCWLLINAVFNEVFDFAFKILSNSSSFPSSLIKKQLEIGSYPNYFLLRPDGNEITVDQIRSLQNFLANHSFIDGYRVIIIDEIDRLNRFASNALLKICEEPPKNTIILGVCNKVHLIIPTLRSRFQKLLFQEKNEINDLENVKKAMILAYTGKIEELRYWINANINDQTKVDDYVKMILINIYNGILKKNDDKRLLDAYQAIENFENLNLNPKHYIFRCMLFLTNTN